MSHDRNRCQVCLVFVQPELAAELLVQGQDGGQPFAYCRDHAACGRRVETAAALDRAITAARSRVAA